MAGQYLQDWWFHPIVIIEGVNDSLLVNSGFGPTVLAVLAPGLYYWWLGRGPETAIPGRLNFEEALWAALDDVGYTMANGEEGSILVPPIASPGMTTKGWNFSAADDQQCGLFFSSAQSTMDPRWFGFPPGVDQVKEPGELDLISKFGVWGIWKPVTVNPAIHASDKRSFPVNDTEWSSTRSRGRVVSNWNQEQVRGMRYQNIRAGHVYPSRNMDLGYATRAGLGLGDQGNGWLDVWDALANNLPVYIVHDFPELPVIGTVTLPPVDGTVDLNYHLDEVTLATKNQALSPEATAKMVRAEGEVYDISTRLMVTQAGDWKVYPQ